MPWVYRGSSSRSKGRKGGFPQTAWNTRGETMSLNNALATYDLTEEQVMNSDPPVSCQWRSCHGNPYAVVKCSEMRQLKARLERQEKEKAEQELIAKLGNEGYDKMKAEEKAKKEAEMVAAAAQQKRKEIKERLTKMLVALLDVLTADGVSVVPTLEGRTLAKTSVKKDWYLKDSDLESLTAETVGRSTKYALRDVIVKSESKQGSVFPPDGYSYRSSSGTLTLKIMSSAEKMGLYARYLRDRFDEECNGHPDDLVSEATQDARAEFQKVVDEADVQLKKAEETCRKGRKRLVEFDNLAGTVRGAARTGDDAEGQQMKAEGADAGTDLEKDAEPNQAKKPRIK